MCLKKQIFNFLDALNYKGTYIIRVSRFAAYSSGLEYTDGTYRMKYSFTAANNNETEPNDSFATAMPLTANQKVTGFLAQNDTLDYYSITIPSRQKIQIKCTAMLYTWIKIYDEDLNSLKTVEGSYGTSESKPQVLTYEAELVAGTYYIKPSAGTNFNASYGNYILSWAPADTSNTSGNTNTSSNSNTSGNTNTSSNSNTSSNTNTSSSSNTNKSTMIYSPKKTTIRKVQGKSKSIKITIKKPTSKITGYQVQYATNSKFSRGKIKSTRQTTITIKQLKAKKTYYVRVRTYRKGSGTTYYSSWSKAKSIKTKK